MYMWACAMKDELFNALYELLTLAQVRVRVYVRR
jgi:hypothetical protein